MKGKPFSPDARMKKILTDAAALGNAAGRSLNFRGAEYPGWAYYPGSMWANMLWEGGYTFETPPPAITKEGILPADAVDRRATLDSRTAFYYGYTMDSPGMIMRLPMVGSQYLMGFTDAGKNPFDGGKTYRVTLPKDIPAAKFWSFTLYDNQTRSMLQTPQRFPRAGSQTYPSPAAVPNADGSTTIYFGPTKPADAKAGNWIQTMPGKRMVHDPSPLQPQGVVLRQELAAERDRARALSMRALRRGALCLFLLAAGRAQRLDGASRPCQFPDYPPDSRLKAVVQPAVDEYRRPGGRLGLSIGIFREGKFTCFNFGDTSKSDISTPTSQSIYEIGSITKTFTGVLLAGAVDAGLLKFDDDIRKYLPGKFPNLVYEGHPIRIIDLANQTSGLPRNSTHIPEGATPDDIVRLERDNDTARFLESLHALKLDRAPGRELQYSNAAFGLLGIILEKVYGMPYDELVRAAIANGLAMHDTGIQLSESQQKRFVPGHSNDGQPRPPVILGVPGSGGLRSDVDDLLLYARANATARTGPFVVSHQLTAGDASNGVGLGWELDKTQRGDARISHDGGMLGYSAYIAIVPGRSFGVVLLTNQSGVLEDLRKLGARLTESLAR